MDALLFWREFSFSEREAKEWWECLWRNRVLWKCFRDLSFKYSRMVASLLLSKWRIPERNFSVWFLYADCSDGTAFDRPSWIWGSPVFYPLPCMKSTRSWYTCPICGPSLIASSGVGVSSLIVWLGAWVLVCRESMTHATALIVDTERLLTKNPFSHLHRLTWPDIEGSTLVYWSWSSWLANQTVSHPSVQSLCVVYHVTHSRWSDPSTCSYNLPSTHPI